MRKTGADGKTVVDDAAVTERLRYYSEWSGADPAKTQSCAEAPATAERIARSQQLGQTIGSTRLLPCSSMAAASATQAARSTRR